MCLSKIKIFGLSLLLFGCADATRTIPVLTLEHRSISAVNTAEISNRKELAVPNNLTYLPPPIEKIPLPPIRNF